MAFYGHYIQVLSILSCMVAPIDDNSLTIDANTGLHVSDSSATMQPVLDALDRVIIESSESLDNLFSELHKLELPQELQIAIFGIIGRYFHTLKEARVNHEMSIQMSHMTATSAVMGDPRVAAFIEQQLQAGVANMISGVVN
jgi:hypothetical protein